MYYIFVANKKLLNMELNLKQAKYAIALSRKKDSNMEKVLAEIIAMSKIKKGLSPSELSVSILPKLNIPLALYRKTIHDLYKTGTIMKVKPEQLVFTNPLFINLKQI